MINYILDLDTSSESQGAVQVPARKARLESDFMQSLLLDIVRKQVTAATDPYIKCDLKICG